MKRFLLTLSLFLITVCSIAWVASFLKMSWYHALSIPLVFFFSALSLLTGWLGWKGMKKDPESTINYLLSAMGLHFMICLIGVAVAIILVTGYDLLFTAWFFSLYVLYTCFVVWSLMTTLRPHLRPTK